MTHSLIEQTRTKFNNYKQALDSQNRLRDIRNTHNELKSLKVNLTTLLDIFTRLHVVIDPNAVSSLQSLLQSVQHTLASLQTKFVEKDDYEQAKEVKNIVYTLENMRTQLKQAWVIYVQAQVDNYQETARIARTLPAMQPDIKEIDDLLKKLTKAQYDLPKEREWQQFHKNYRRLQSLLEDLKGLDPARQDLLKKILDDNASLANITPELLQWCQEENIAKSLRLRFQHGN